MPSIQIYFRITACILLLSGSAVSGIMAQDASDAESHLQVAARILVECAQSVLTEQEPFRFDTESVPEPLSIEIMRILAEENGHRLENLPASSSLQLEIDRMGIEWQSVGRKQLRRHVTASSTAIFTSSDGAVTSNSCANTRSALVSREAAETLSDPDIAALQPAIPLKKGLRRVLEPIVLIGASAVGTYLLFNLRSRRTDSN